MNWIKQYHLKMFSIVQVVVASIIIFNYIVTDRFGNISYLFSNAIWLDGYSYSIYMLEQLIWLCWLVPLSSFGIWMYQKWGWWIAIFLYVKNVFFGIYVCVYYFVLATPTEQIPITNIVELFLGFSFSVLCLFYLFNNSVLNKFTFNNRSRGWKIRNLSIAVSLPVFTVLTSFLLSVSSS